jgi:hypothetical protein
MYSLEDRVLMSTIGRSILAPHPADVVSLAHVSHAEVRGDPTEPRAAVRVANHLFRQAAGAAVAPTARKWSWLANTYWYVPTTNLAAVLYNSSTGRLSPVSDQTVFHITGYREGYFWGDTVTQLGSSSPSSSSMLGSVTPQGKVLLTFTQTSTNGSLSITDGYGVMQRKHGQWTMENQMFTAPTETLQIGHWAYTVQTRPGKPSWNSLPGAGVSVPTFLSE